MLLIFHLNPACRAGAITQLFMHKIRSSLAGALPRLSGISTFISDEIGCRSVRRHGAEEEPWHGYSAISILIASKRLSGNLNARHVGTT
jgi:hypothetical protein